MCILFISGWSIDMTDETCIEFRLTGEYVSLCDLLKLAGVAASGGLGKALVAAGEVSVDGQPESRKTAKIRPGQHVVCNGKTIKVL